MSKGSLFMGNARGKLGDIVLYRKDGEQIARTRVRKIGNPRTIQQMRQRVILSTVTKAYSVLEPICNHSFEGENGNIKNMSRFLRENMRYLVGIANTAGQKWRDVVNFNGKQDYECLINNYIISSGTLPPLYYSEEDSDVGIKWNQVINTESKGVTYKDIIESTGLKQGDQLTFLFMINDDGQRQTAQRCEYARLILEPKDGNIESLLINTDGNSWNTASFSDRNENMENVLVEAGEEYTDISYYGEQTKTIGVAIIASRYENGLWRRSRQSLAITNTSKSTYKLGIAVDSWDESVNSSFYLNKALD